MADNVTEEKRILLFEDSNIFANMVLEFLHNAGYKTKRAVNGFEGIKLVYDFMPHIIITDIEMPLFKGYQAARILKARKSTRNIPIIMFSTLNERKDKFWGSQAGADFYIEKTPENFDELKNQIERLLGENRVIDFKGIVRDRKKISDESLIEMINNILDAKLFQTTIIGMLVELSAKLNSLDDIIKSVLDLITNVCEAEIAAMMIKNTGNELLLYTANHAGFTMSIIEDFTAITIADFEGVFPDFGVVNQVRKSFYPENKKKNKLESYISLPLQSRGEKFALVNIANSIKEYFSPVIMENLNMFLSAAAPIIANALSIKRIEDLQRKTRSAFSRYVPVDVMDEIIQRSSYTTNTSETRNTVVLFSDIRNFTKMAENSSAQSIVNFLNSYFTDMCKEILSEGGNIDKFIGDAIMAIFGVPKTLPDAPAAALRAALKMVKAMRNVDISEITQHMAQHGTKFLAGIGINFGECVVGNIGFQYKQDYTVIGDTVNLASRLEGMTKFYHHPIIVSESMYEAAKENFIFRKVESVRVKGKQHPAALYALYDAYTDNATEDSCLILDRELLDLYNKGLKLYSMREWETARQYFNNALKINGKDFLTALYAERTGKFIKNPPPPNWDAAITFTEK